MFPSCAIQTSVSHETCLKFHEIFEMKTVRQCFILELFVCHAKLNCSVTGLLHKRLMVIFFNVNNF